MANAIVSAHVLLFIPYERCLLTHDNVIQFYATFLMMHTLLSYHEIWHAYDLTLGSLCVLLLLGIQYWTVRVLDLFYSDELTATASSIRVLSQISPRRVSVYRPCAGKSKTHVFMHCADYRDCYDAVRGMGRQGCLPRRHGRPRVPTKRARANERRV